MENGFGASVASRRYARDESSIFHSNKLRARLHLAGMREMKGQGIAWISMSAVLHLAGMREMKGESNRSKRQQESCISQVCER